MRIGLRSEEHSHSNVEVANRYLEPGRPAGFMENQNMNLLPGLEISLSALDAMGFELISRRLWERGLVSCQIATEEARVAK